MIFCTIICIRFFQHETISHKGNLVKTEGVLRGAKTFHSTVISLNPGNKISVASESHWYWLDDSLGPPPPSKFKQ